MKKTLGNHNVRRFMAADLAVLFLGGCGKNPAAPGDGQTGGKEKVSLYDRGLELINKMDRMAESGEYAEMMTSSQEVLEVVREIGAGDYSQPKAVYQVKMSKEVMENLFDLYGGQMDSLPEELKEELKHRIASSVPTMVSAVEGSDVLAAISLMAADDYFIDSSMTEDAIYFYMYEGKCCGAVVFSARDEGIVTASGRMIVSEALSQAAGQEEVKEWLVQNAGLLGIEISEVSP